MSIIVSPYESGDPIIPGTTYSFYVPVFGYSAWMLSSKVVGAILQVTLTTPVDEAWSNVTTFEIEGEVAGRLLKLEDNAYPYYFRVIGPPTLAHDSTLALRDLEMEWPSDIIPTAIPTDGSPIQNGFYSLDALSLTVGKFHSFSIVPAKSGNLVGKHDTSDQHRFVATIFGVNAQGYPVSHMASFSNTEQALFNMDTAKAVLHLSAPEGAEFNYTCSIASFSSGSEGQLTPSSDATITGAWSFTNITVPTPTQAGQAANKGYVDTQVSNCVKLTGNQNISGVKTFTDGMTLADEKPLNLGSGMDAIKIHGDGMGNAVIEGGNGATLDIAIPLTIQEPTTVTDTITNLYSGTTGEGVVSKFITDLATYELRLRKTDGALRITGAGGTNSFVSLSSSGAGGENGAALDIEVPADFSEPVTFSKLKSDVSGTLGRTVQVYEAKAGSSTFEFVQYDTTGTFIFRPLNLTGAGLGVNPQGIVTLHGQVLAEKAVNFTAGVTMGQTLTVAGAVTLLSPIRLGDGGVYFYGQQYDNKPILAVYPVTGLGSDRATMYLGSLDEGGSGVFSSDGLVITQASGDARYALKSEVTSGLTQATADARYGKLAGGNTWSGMQKFSSPPQVDDGSGTFKTALTIVVLQQATYDGLESKDDYTMYYAQDTSKVYLGTIALN